MENKTGRVKEALRRVMRRRFAAAAILLWALAAPVTAGAATRLIVRTGNLLSLEGVCALLGCQVQYGLGDPQGQLFLVTSPLDLPVNQVVSIPGVLDAEVDQTGYTLDAVSQGTVPSALYDSTPINYYGTTVRHGYVYQPATQIVRLADAQSMFQVSGAGIVAVIDTGVDTTHPVLQRVLLPGYDFTRNQAGADEKGDVNQSTTAVVDQSTTAVVDQSTTAVVDQSTTAVVDQATGSNLNQPQYRAFGHGTMTSGIVHLVAPRAWILPLKAFHVDGSGYESDVLRAIYYAVRNHANVLSMSFSFPTPSQELQQALSYANLNGVIAAAAAGNSGEQTLVYPAAYQSLVMGVASTSNNDTLSTFSNYGPNLVWVGAPGEGIVTLYPYSTYAATWGTSFSTPFVAGTAALLFDLRPLLCTESGAAQAIAHARYISPAVGHGRLDVYQALQAWQDPF